jgi:hypothetical protein
VPQRTPHPETEAALQPQQGEENMKARLIGLALISALIVIPATAATAHEFTASETTIVTDTGGNQVFHTNAGTVVCARVTSTGTATAGTNIQTLVATLTFTECEGFGEAAKISPVILLLMANGYVDLLENAVVTVPVAKCSILVPGSAVGSGTVNKSLKTVEYKNSGKGIVVTGNVTGITYEPSGGICGTAKTPAHNGTYTGIGFVEPEKGTLTWK